VETRYQHEQEKREGGKKVFLTMNSNTREFKEDRKRGWAGRRKKIKESCWAERGFPRPKPQSKKISIGPESNSHGRHSQRGNVKTPVFTRSGEGDQGKIVA